MWNAGPNGRPAWRVEGFNGQGDNGETAAKAGPTRTQMNQAGGGVESTVGFTGDNGARSASRCERKMMRAPRL